MSKWDEWEYECGRTCDQLDGDCRKCRIEEKCKEITKRLNSEAATVPHG